MEKKQSADTWPKIDMIEGQIKTYFQIPKNFIYTQEYSLNFGILISIFHAFINPSALALISTIIICAIIPDYSPYCIVMYAGEFSLIVFTFIIKKILISRAKMNADQKINKRTAKVYRGNQCFEQMEWGQIQQGDIVYLCEGQTSPADIVVLDSQQIEHRQAITYVDVKKLNGEIVCQKKKACYLTQIVNRSSNQKRVWSEYRKILTGRITYEKPSAQMSSFTGYLKLIKDPKMEKLSIQNMILRESIIKTSLWVYGLVVYPGMDSKVMKSFKQGNKLRNTILTTENKNFFLIMLLNIVLGALFTGIYFMTGQRKQNKIYLLTYHVLMFSVLLPHLKLLAKDIYLVTMKCSNKISEVQIRNFQNFQQIGEISFAVVSNVGTLTTGRLQVNQITTQSSIYTFEGDEIKISGDIRNEKISRRRMGSSSGNQNSQPGKKINNKLLLPVLNYDRKSSALVFKQDFISPLPEQNFEIDDDTNIRLKQRSSFNSSCSKISKLSAHLEPLKLDRNRFYNYVKRNQNQSNEIIKALALCHQAKLYYVANKDKYVGVSNVNSEQVLLKLVDYVGWSIIPKNVDKKQVGLIISQQKEKYDEITGVFKFQAVKRTYNWVGVNSFHIQRKIFSVVVQHDNKTTLYCKGRPQDMIERLKLSKQTQKTIEQAIASYSKKQSQIVIYAKKQFTEEERDNYENDYISLKSSLTTNEAEIDQFSKRYQKNLDFICIIGMSTQMNPEAKPFIKYIRDSEIKPCIFVNDKSETLSIKKMIMEEQEYKDILLEGDSAELIKYYLNQVTNLIQNNQNFKYVINLQGNAWRVILENSQILQHFMLVLYYSQAVLGIKFMADDIRQLTHRIRFSYPEEQKILGIGYSYSDLKFLGESDVSISTCQDLPADVKAQSLLKIIESLKIGPYLLKIKLCQNSIVYYRVVVISAVALFYEILLSFFKTSKTINGHLVFFYLVIYTLLQIIYNYYLLRTPTKVQQGNKYKQFGKAKKKFYIEHIQALLHGTIVIISLYFNLSGAKFQKAKIFTIEALDLSVFITLILIGMFRNVFNKSFSKLNLAVTSLITASVMALCVFLASLQNLKFYRVYSQFVNIFSSYDSIVSILNCTIFCLGISLFLQQILKKRIQRDAFLKQIKPENSLKNKKKQIIQIIKHLYQDQENMDSSVQGVVSSQLDVNKLKISKCLKIKKQQDNIKYLSQCIQKNRQTIIKVNIILSLFFLTMILVDVLFVKQQQFVPYQVTLIVGLVCSVGALVVLYFKEEIYMSIYNVIAVLITVFSIVMVIYSFYQDQSSGFLMICLLSVMVTQSLNVNFPVLSLLMLAIIIAGIAQIFVKSNQTVNLILFPVLQIACILFNLRIFYKSELSARINFVKAEAFQKQSNYVSDILSILVPKFIKNHLQGNQFSLQQEQKKVSILFCYVCNFDQIVKQQGTNVVPLMDELFRQFDQLCHNFAVQKIQTVGQTYMAATGIKAYENQIQNQMKNRNQVERLLKMAIQMLQKSKDIMWGTKKNKKLTIKIGIHHGNVIIGVIGFHKPQFSLIGDAVNTTSRHCSTANPGEVVVSSVAFQLLKKFPASSFTKSTKKMKGLGQVPIYRYNNNVGKQKNHMKLRIKFQNIVRKVIENLRKQGKIKYKKFVASQLVENVLMRQRLSTKKMTKATQLRNSLSLQNFEHSDLIINIKQNKYADLCLKYNKFLQLQEKNSNLKKYLITNHITQDRIGLVLLFVVYLVCFLVEITSLKSRTQSLALMVIGLVMFPISFLLYKKSIKHKIFNVLYVILDCYLILSVNLKIFLDSSDSQTLLPFLPHFYQIMSTVICGSQKSFRFIHTLVLVIFSTLISATVMFVTLKFDLSIIFQIFICAFVLNRKYSDLKQCYDNYSQSQINQKKAQQISALVSQLLPKHAYQKLKNQSIQNKLQLTDQFEGATILFADIKGFTSYSNKNPPAAVVKMLRQLFQEFDKLCLKFNVYKLYTIGDCYVVLGFTNCYQRDYVLEAKNVVNMGLAMVQTIQRVREILDFPELDMRIGVHTGTIIGGIIGTQIVRYDIYGPDVMVANKFEQFGKTGFIHISQSTKEILDQDKKKSFNIVPNGTVKVQKLNAQYNGYILSKKKFQI